MQFYRFFGRLIFCFILIGIVKVHANELDMRERELYEMQIQLEEQRRIVREAEQKRLLAMQSRQQTQNQLIITQRRLQELNTAQRNLERSFEHSNNILNQTENIISQVQSNINHTFLYLLFAHQAETKLNQKDNDSLILSLVLKKLFTENTKLRDEYTNISRERQTREREYTEAQNLSRNEQSRLDNFSSDLARIDSDIEAFERQRIEYQRRADELESSAFALQELINTFRTDHHQLTYNFPNGFEPPINGRIIRYFGIRRHESYDISTFSNSIIIAAQMGSDVKAFADGEIVFSDSFMGYGRLIIINHKNGFHTVYGYNSTLLAQRGDIVSKGQVIAHSGSTGSATEPSLHFEIRRNGNPINPLELIFISP